MKVYQKLEQLFKLRAHENTDIEEYVNTLSMSNKFDEPKKIAMFVYLLQQVDILEKAAIILSDRCRALEGQSNTPATTITPTKEGIDEEDEEIWNDPAAFQKALQEKPPILTEEAKLYICEECNKAFTTALGKTGHMRTHKKKA